MIIQVKTLESKNIFNNLASMAEPLEEDLSAELDLYLSSHAEYVEDVLTWWIEWWDTYPYLSRMAIDFLTIPST